MAFTRLPSEPPDGFSPRTMLAAACVGRDSFPPIKQGESQSRLEARGRMRLGRCSKCYCAIIAGSDGRLRHRF